jgi:hypothetical protein
MNKYIFEISFLLFIVNPHAVLKVVAFLFMQRISPYCLTYPVGGRMVIENLSSGKATDARPTSHSQDQRAEIEAIRPRKVSDLERVRGNECLQISLMGPP